MVATPFIVWEGEEIATIWTQPQQPPPLTRTQKPIFIVSLAVLLRPAKKDKKRARHENSCLAHLPLFTKFEALHAYLAW